MIQTNQMISRRFIPFIFSILLIVGCGPRQSKNQNRLEMDSLQGQLVIFHAGSLSLPFRILADSFTSQYPRVEVLLEASGSLASIRKITDLGRKADILASADAHMIDRFLIPAYASWNLIFATNELVVAFHKKSRYKDEIHKDNWIEVLRKPDVRYGRSDPYSDPCGYRSLLMMQLAEDYYQEAGLASDLSARHQQFIRPKEVDLLALLETSTIDYIFIYKSVAVQHGLLHIDLPTEINLGNPGLDSLYGAYHVSIPGDRPGAFMDISGAPIEYGICILNDAPNRILAKAFMKFLVEEENGLAILKAQGQDPYPGDLKHRLDSLMNLKQAASTGTH